MSWWQEFKQFTMRGNIIDFAAAIIIGTAFGKIISTFVNEVLMPPLGLLISGIDFRALKYELKAATAQSGAVVINYGLFINALIDFLLIALAVFFLIKIAASFKKKAAQADKKCPECLMPVPLLAKRCGHCTQSLGLKAYPD